MAESREAPREVKIRLTDEQHAGVLRIKKSTGDTIAVIVRRYVREGLDREDQKGIAPLKERIGEKLIRLGKISEEQTREVLRFQKKDNGRFGEIAVKQGFISKATLDDCL